MDNRERDARNYTPRSRDASSLNDVTNSSVLRHALRERRFARNRKACLPCRERKVRCDGSLPCLTCSKRQHPDLCQFYQPRPYPVQPDDGARKTPEAAPQKWSLSASPRTGTSPSILGDSSILAVTRQSDAPSHPEPDRQSAFEDGILPLLGIRGSSCLSTSKHRQDDLFVGGVNNREAVLLFETYRHSIHPFRAIVYDLTEVEELMCSLLDPCIEPQGRGTPDIPDAIASRHTMQLRALLHAILAYGAQFSDFPVDRRIQLTQKHLTYTLNILRSVQYLSNPSKETLQTLMVLGCVLQNDMQPQAAWMLGGTTIRLAIFLGIDKRSNQYTSGISPEEAKFLRLAITWQDSLLSLAFDRPPATYEMDHEDDLTPLDMANIGTLNYRKCINWLSHLTLRHSSALRSGSSMSSKQYMELFEQVDAMDKFLMPYLQDRQMCSCLKEVQEYYGLQLHRNFLLSTLCRPLLSSRVRSCMSEDDANAILQRFYVSLRHGARSFLHLRSITCQAKRSWAFVHNGLTSVLLLSFMKETRNLEETKQMQSELLESLMEEDDCVVSGRESGPLTQLSTTHQKAVLAIQALAKLTKEETTTTTEDLTAPPFTSHGPNADDAPALPVLPEEDIQAGTLDMDELLRNIDYNCYSPLEALDFILSDQSMSGQDAFLL
ncbi:c6 zinc finger domain containing protein [Grosmannia clavigera kw1407]|uniref:C6 zinc finger domain containing protein n=1 Tax=Grosmannia clavigera (strain kw1407 / UAMH 11150) TaxID=655863 RepID=F0XKQ4_GROCL|nr:c6 zinc finger domain containing protein [Grosmannia clavigera kw1407]EFX01710.1 c6 zinc finger domain containing protein [Grosmannia clavigera kw1407]